MKRRGDTSPDKLADAGGLVLLDERGEALQVAAPPIAEALRYFVTRVQNSGDLEFPRSLAITSALADEGVSFVARSLCAVLAHDLQRSVCLVETNWWVHGRHLGEEPSRPGLADVLSGSAALEDAVSPTSDPRLSVLAAGHVAGRDRPALARSDAMTDLLRLLGKQFDIVVIDAPPVLRVSESIEIVRRADAAAVVVHHGVTTERQVAAALAELATANVLGLILNRSHSRIPGLLRRFADAD